MYLNTVALLESVGFTFGLDFDDELMIEYPLEFDPKPLADKLATEHVQEITNYLKRRGQRAREQFVGGPLDGQPHKGLIWLTVEVGTTLVTYGYLLHHVAPADWAVYLGNPHDGRAFFQGSVTSERKGRRKVYDLIAARGSVEKAQ